MRRYVSVVLLTVCVFCSSGCAYLFPAQSKALTEQEQVKEMREQNKTMERQTAALERIASALEKISKSK